jgi:phage terminase large subunit-like protein
VRQDPAGNVKPDKEKSTEKIDGVVAMIMGLDRALRAVTGTSVYELHGDRAGKLLSLEPETD